MDMEIYLAGNQKVYAKYGQYVIETDQPVRSGGDGTAPSPFDLFLASLGTCSGFFVLRFLQQRGLSTDGVRVMFHGDRNADTHLVDKISLQIKLPVDFPEKYTEAIIRTVDQCTVKRHLDNPPDFDVSVTIG